jgi:hypothetical protein
MRFLKAFLVTIAMIGTLGLMSMYVLLHLRAPLCTSSGGHIIWYSKGNTCSYVNYDSCLLFPNRLPLGATAECEDESQKIAILEKDAIRLVGASVDKTFSEQCKRVMSLLYARTDKDLSTVALNSMHYTWGISGKAVARACKSFILDSEYNSAIIDTRF